MISKKFFITIFAVIGLLVTLYYLGYFLVSEDFLPELAKSAGSLITFSNNLELRNAVTIPLSF